MKAERIELSVAAPIHPSEGPVMAVPFRSGEVDGMGAATVGADDARRRALLFMGFLAVVEPFELQRFALLSTIWDAQLTVVEVPGCGFGSARLGNAERRALRRGDFRPVAHRIVNAALIHSAALGNDSITVAGYSLGASLAAAATTADQLQVDTVVLVEPVATHRWALPRLIRATRREDDVLDEYLDRNDDLPAAVLPLDRRGDRPPRQSRIDLAHLGFGLSRGGIALDIERGHARHSFALEVAHGRRSLLSRRAQVARFVDHTRSLGIDVRDVPLPGRHALWHSLPDVARLARLTSDRWTT